MAFSRLPPRFALSPRTGAHQVQSILSHYSCMPLQSTTHPQAYARHALDPLAGSSRRLPRRTTRTQSGPHRFLFPLVNFSHSTPCRNACSPSGPLHTPVKLCGSSRALPRQAHRAQWVSSKPVSYPVIPYATAHDVRECSIWSTRNFRHALLLITQSAEPSGPISIWGIPCAD